MKTAALIALATCVFAFGCSGAVGVEETPTAKADTEGLSSNNWVGWSPLPARANGFADSPAVIRLSDNTLEVIARDAVDNRLLRSRKIGYNGAWSAWGATFGNDAFIGKPAAVGLDEDYPGSGKYVVFAQKADGRYYTRYMPVGGNPLSPWTAISNDVFESSPAVAIAGRVMWVVGRKSDGLLYETHQTLGYVEPYTIGAFTPFAPLPGPPETDFIGNPAVSGSAFWKTGGPTFYTRLRNNYFVMNELYRDGTFSGWQRFGTEGFASEPAVTSSYRVAVATVFGKSRPSNRIFQQTGFLGEWDAGSELGTNSFVAAPAAVDGTYSYGGPGLGLLHHVVAKTADGQLHMNSQRNSGARRRACDELNALRQKVPHVRPILLPAEAADFTLNTGDALVARNLDGVRLDRTPPVVGTPNPPYASIYTDDAPAGQAPFLTGAIQSFRHEHFQNEFMLSGRRTYGAADYAAIRGFRFLQTADRNLAQQGHMPPETKWARIVGFDWKKWMRDHSLDDGQWPQGQWQKLADLDLVALLTAEGFPVLPQGIAWGQEAVLMLDIENPVLAPEALRLEPFYPANGSAEEKAEFEADYYAGARAMFTAPVDVARARGYSFVSIYGWQPVPRKWWGLENVQVDPATDFAWNTYGRDIYQKVDGINPSVYSFYWDPKNLAYTLATIDLNLAMLRNESARKQVRPYFWAKLHGGGDGNRWWKHQPAATEEVRALTAMGFFTGADGHVQWDYTGNAATTAFSVPSLPDPTPAPGGYRMIGKAFRHIPLPPHAGTTNFQRYQVIYISHVDLNGNAYFQLVNPTLPEPYGIAPDKPRYQLPGSTLRTYLRADSEAYAGVFEGMALVKPFEVSLRTGEVKIDVPAQVQFRDDLAVSRRVKSEGLHVLIANSPRAVYGGQTQTIVLQNFDGRPGRTLRVPADAETRIWALLETPCD
ncbi:MAG TPA: hypothetical protein VGK73_27410 [Polyangiaceae bacterium]